MLTILIFLILGYSFYTGYRRGLINQTIRLGSMVLSLLLGNLFFRPLAHLLEMVIPFPAITSATHLAVYSEEMSFFISDAFYNTLSYVLIGLAVNLIVKLFSILTRPLTTYPVLRQFNGVVGGVINVIIVYIIIFFALFILSLLPVEPIQQQFVNNPIAYWIVTQSPILSGTLAKGLFKLN